MDIMLRAHCCENVGRFCIALRSWSAGYWYQHRCACVFHDVCVYDVRMKMYYNLFRESCHTMCFLSRAAILRAKPIVWTRSVNGAARKKADDSYASGMDAADRTNDLKIRWTWNRIFRIWFLANARPQAIMLPGRELISSDTDEISPSQCILARARSRNVVCIWCCVWLWRTNRVR